MVWPEVSIEDFLPRRDDEPASLRQDILDELTDHFVCALNRELLKNPDEGLAQERVIKKFGDPIKIAHQLWFDAMKERIMSQRIMTGISVVMAVCCITVVGIAWSLMNQSQAVNQKMLEQLAVIADRPQPVDTTKIDQKMLNQLEKLNQKQMVQAVPVSEEMYQVSFQLVQDNTDKKPAVGFTGKLVKSGDQTDSFTLEAVSNDEGKLNFGKLPWGKYQLDVNAPWGEYNRQSDVTVIPGRSYIQTIACPAAAPTEVPVQFQINWPDTLRSEDWVLLCDFRSKGFAGGTPGGLTRVIDNNLNFWTSSTPNVFEKQSLVFLIEHNDEISLCPLGHQGEFKDVDLRTLVAKPSINLSEGGSYILSIIYLIPKKNLTQLSKINLNQTFSVLNHQRTMLLTFDQFYRLPQEQGDSFQSSDIYPPITTMLVPFNNYTTGSDSKNLNSISKYADGIRFSNWLTFSAVKDQKNIWKIKIPDLEKLKIPEGVERGGRIGVGQGFF